MRSNLQRIASTWLLPITLLVMSPVILGTAWKLWRKKKTMDDFYKFENNQLNLIPPFEHKEPKDDDCGMPEHPIFSNYSKYLWTSHRRTGGVEIGGPPRTYSITVKPETKPSQ